MASKQTLAEKFASRKSHTYTASLDAKRDFSAKPPRPEPSARFGLLKRDDSLRSKYEQSKTGAWGRKSHLPGSFRSPIKTITISPRRAQASTIYKVPREGSRFPRDLGVIRDSGVFKKERPRNNSGLLSRFKSFLSSMQSYGDGQSEVETLRRSANVAIPKTPPRPLPPKKRQLSPEQDEVDFAIREAEHKRECLKIQREKEAFEAQLAAEKAEKKALKEEYDRKLYLLRGDFESQVHSLDEKIEQLAQGSHARSMEFEREHLDTIQQVVLQQNETFLVHQRESESRIEALNRRIAEKERDLVAREGHLKAMIDKLVAEKQSLQGRESPCPRLDTTKFEMYLAERERLHEAKAAVEKSTVQHESDIIDFYETLQASSRPSSGESYLSEDGLLKQVQKLLASLDADASARDHSYFQKFREYDSFFSEFSQENREMYSPEVLSGIETSFQTVKEHLHEKLARIGAQRQQYDAVIGQRPFASSGEATKVVEALTGRTKVLSRQQQTVELLERLNELAKRLEEIKAQCTDHGGELL